MTFQSEVLLIISDTIGGIIKNLPYYLLIIWGVKTIAKQMPKWIEQMFREMQKAKTLDKALEGKRMNYSSSSSS